MGKSTMNDGFSLAMFDDRRVCHIWIHLPANLGFSRGTSGQETHPHMFLQGLEMLLRTMGVAEDGGRLHPKNGH